MGWLATDFHISTVYVTVSAKIWLIYIKMSIEIFVNYVCDQCEQDAITQRRKTQFDQTYNPS